MQENIKFCIITTRIEDALAISPLIPTDDLLLLDNNLVEWFQNLPPALQASQTTPSQQSNEMPGMTVAKSVMRWRFYLARISIHRPVLLWYALQRVPPAGLCREKQKVIEKCRGAAADLIADIASTLKSSKPCQISGWNATWMVYQASMVPLLSLFSDAVDSAVVNNCRHQIETVMGALSELGPWSATAHRSLEVVSRIYDASKRFTLQSLQSQTEQPPTPSQFYDPVHDGRSLYSEQTINAAFQQSDSSMDSMWDSLNWSTGWENMDYPFDTTSSDWEYGSVAGWTDGTGVGSLPFDVAFPTPSGQMMNSVANTQPLYQQNQ